MVDKQPANAPDLHERFAAIQQKNSWHNTVIMGVFILVLGLALIMYGVPDVEADASGIISGAVVLWMVYLIFIRKRKLDVDAEILVTMLEQAWKSGRIGDAAWNELEFSLPNIQIEQFADDFWLVSCRNKYGGTKTLGIRGSDARSLQIMQIYEGDASTTRRALEKSKVVMTALERGHEIRKIETMIEKLGG